MEKPIKNNYDVNDHFECMRYLKDMIKYVDFLESEFLRIEKRIIKLLKK